MVTQKQNKAPRKNINKSQKVWKQMKPLEQALTQPQGRGRSKIGTKGEGKYYRVEVRPKSEFTTFRYQDIGKPGGILRLAGKRSSGSWDDHVWLIDKKMAHISDDTLIPDNPDAQEVLESIGPAQHVKGDIFKGHPKKNTPEKDKPTPRQEKARQENIQKAQEARWPH